MRVAEVWQYKINLLKGLLKEASFTDKLARTDFMNEVLGYMYQRQTQQSVQYLDYSPDNQNKVDSDQELDLTDRKGSIYELLLEWLVTNRKLQIEGQGFRQMMLIGGSGGTGKTTIGSGLSIGMAFPNINQTKTKDGQFDRSADLECSALRFCDETPALGEGKINIFTDFTEFEKAQCRLFKSNMNDKAIEFILATGSKLTHYPNRIQYLQHYKGKPPQTYENWCSQVVRRLKFYVLKANTKNNDSFIEDYDELWGRNRPKEAPLTGIQDFIYNVLIKEWRYSPMFTFLYSKHPNTGQNAISRLQDGNMEGPVVNFWILLEEIFWCMLWMRAYNANVN